MGDGDGDGNLMGLIHERHDPWNLFHIMWAAKRLHGSHLLFPAAQPHLWCHNPTPDAQGSTCELGLKHPCDARRLAPHVEDRPLEGVAGRDSRPGDDLAGGRAKVIHGRGRKCVAGVLTTGRKQDRVALERWA